MQTLSELKGDLQMWRLFLRVTNHPMLTERLRERVCETAQQIAEIENRVLRTIF